MFHELGHAAEFHNHPLFGDETYDHRILLSWKRDFLLWCFREGVALDFERTGSNFLIENYFLDGNKGLVTKFSNAHKRLSMTRKFPGRAKAFTGKYAKGKRMVEHLKKRGVTIEQMIKDMEGFLPELEKKFG